MPTQPLIAALVALALTGCASLSSQPPSTTLPPSPVCHEHPLENRALFLRGAFNNWTAREPERFTYRCDRFEAVVNLKGEHPFKIADEGWSADADFGAVDHRAGASRRVALRGMNLSHVFNGLHKITLFPKQLTMTIESCPQPALGATKLFLRGTMNHWGTTDDHAFAWRCDAYYVDVVLAGGQEFKIADAAWTEATTFGFAPNTAESLRLQAPSARLSRAADAPGLSSVPFMFNGPQTLRLSFENAVASLTVMPTPLDDPSVGNVNDPQALKVKFNSRDSRHKSPFGPIKQGESIDFLIAGDASLTAAALVIERRRLEGNQEILEYLPHARVPMQRETAANGEIRWRASARFDAVAVYGYHFDLEIGGKRYLYGNNRDSIFWSRERGSNGVGEIVNVPDDLARVRRFQQTVYQRDFKVPEWSADVVYYYIFPDRFRNGNPANDPKPGKDRFQQGTVEHHSDWHQKPFRPKSGDGSDDLYSNDFFGGDLAGIIEKLDYIRDLGANTLYLTPIFRAASNHKYDTADYKAIDPAFGTEAEFDQLTAEAKKRGIRVMLDTSLNHVGADSRYFDRFGHFAATDRGAFTHEKIDPNSPYADWFAFDPTRANPDQQYKGWTGISDLPEINKAAPSFRAFAYGDADSVMKRWLARGASGWRMDVAPWVPDDFWREWRTAIRGHTPDALTIAEAWFNGSKYLLGDMFDGTMNYIFRNTVQEFALGGDARLLYPNLEFIRENYPLPAQLAMMNVLSSHDQPRALHQFGFHDDSTTAENIALAKVRLRLSAFFQAVWPGAPTIYYGDEVGVTGGDDPYNRATYPWADLGGTPDLALHADYKRLLAMRKRHSVLRHGALTAPIYIDANVIVVARETEQEIALIALSNGDSARNITFSLPNQYAAIARWNDAFSDIAVNTTQGAITLQIEPRFGRVLVARKM